MKKQLHGKKSGPFEYLVINLFVFAGIGLMSFVLFNVSLFNPFTKVFKDFTLTDLYYSTIKSQDNIYQGPLVLINVENKNREEIAFLLQRLEEGNPKVIGLDIIFPDKKDSASDEILKQTFPRYNNIVLPYIASFDSSVTEIKNHEYFQTSPAGFVNLVGEDREFSTIRYYYPVYNNVPAFTTAVLHMYDPGKASTLFKKGQKKTEIRYFGNIQNFRYRTFDEVMDPSFDPGVLKDKIILLGYMGKVDGSSGALDEDRFFTPLNPRLSGRSHPDMYGAVLNANILRMALDKDYVYSFPQWLNLLLAFMISLLFLPWLVKTWVHKGVWFHLVILLVQLTISILFVFLTILLYAKANVKIESSAVLVSVLLLGDFILFYDAIVQYLKRRSKWKFHSKFFEGVH
ncbi:MAG TPA: CHASE2 domain-containing protein [Chitinophagaceae bacterium]|nr:CHASE2 domain-containing protein [Chitinophagaceae bacterium]